MFAQGKKPFSVPGTRYKKVSSTDKSINNSENKGMMVKPPKTSGKPAVCPPGTKYKKKAISHSGSFHGKSNQLGQGGRAAQMRAQGVPGGVIGAIARREQAGPGQKNFHKRK